MSMREITTHHDGHGLTELIEVAALGEPEGGAVHRYEFLRRSDADTKQATRATVGFLQFQRGPRGVAGSTPGLLTVAVLAALIDHHKGFQGGPFPSRENALVITKLEEALHWLRARADERAARGVLGQNAK